MTQTKLIPETKSQQFTCLTCPNFENFNGERGRGLCKYHDQVVFEHHQSRNECISALERESAKHLKTYELPEDIPPCEFEPGEKVKVIDEGEDNHEEWSSFVVITKVINPNRFSSTESYLNQPNWYFLLASIDRPNPNMFWVAESEICHAHQSHLIDTSEPF
ncbi:MAG: hypothetical protein AB4368_22895 [Xenococcaceae cyanobacterium]